MTARLLKESEAWRELAERAVVPNGRDYSQGLCFAVVDLWHQKFVDVPTYHGMAERIDRHMVVLCDNGGDGYLVTTEDGPVDYRRAVRATAALFLSYEAEEEGK